MNKKFHTEADDEVDVETKLLLRGVFVHICMYVSYKQKNAQGFRITDVFMCSMRDLAWQYCMGLNYVLIIVYLLKLCFGHSP